MARDPWTKLDGDRHARDIPYATLAEALKGARVRYVVQPHGKVRGPDSWIDTRSDGGHVPDCVSGSLKDAKRFLDLRLARAEARARTDVAREVGLDPVLWEFDVHDPKPGACFLHRGDSEGDALIWSEEGEWVLFLDDRKVTFDSARDAATAFSFLPQAPRMADEARAKAIRAFDGDPDGIMSCFVKEHGWGPEPWRKTVDAEGRLVLSQAANDVAFSIQADEGGFTLRKHASLGQAFAHGGEGEVTANGIATVEEAYDGFLAEAGLKDEGPHP